MGNSPGRCLHPGVDVLDTIGGQVGPLRYSKMVRDIYDILLPVDPLIPDSGVVRTRLYLSRFKNAFSTLLSATMTAFLDHSKQ